MQFFGVGGRGKDETFGLCGVCHFIRIVEIKDRLVKVFEGIKTNIIFQILETVIKDFDSLRSAVLVLSLSLDILLDSILLFLFFFKSLCDIKKYISNF